LPTAYSKLSMAATNECRCSPTTNTKIIMLQLSLPGVSTVTPKSRWDFYFERSCNEAAKKPLKWTGMCWILVLLTD
jgi:hypothetical protein